MKDANTVLMIAAGIVLFLAVLVFVVWARLSRLSQAHNELQKQLTDAHHTQDQSQILRAEVAEVRSALENIAKHVQQLRGKTDELAQLQDNIAESDPQARLYSRAVKMIELGAPMEEVMQECELPRAEAELLFSLHAKS
ncbi:DUF2802 domain-containing protein [Pseudoalteromonas sp. SSDWG2]|uniref:DUF2802 domain-containing protein n=1 Tax=Pseudoalteromonas sp. SSDWG2 TaxID=3139391 RepID=UPI003BA8470B